MPFLLWLSLLIALLVGACHQPPKGEARNAASPASVHTPALPTGGSSTAESLLVDVQSLDSTIRVDVRYADRNNFTGAPLPGYEAPRVLLRREPVLALVRVQARLRTGGLGLLVFDGYRPVRATRAMVK